MEDPLLFGIKQDDLEKYTEILQSGELDGYLSEGGLSPEVIKLINEIVSGNDEKTFEAINEKIPRSLEGFLVNELEEFKKAKKEKENFSKEYRSHIERMGHELAAREYAILEEKFKMLDINAKKSERDRECSSWFGGFKNNTECKELLKHIKELEMKQIRENYGRLLNNYYMTLAQYLVQCRDFETSADGLIPPNYDKQKQELELKMEEFQTNNCGGSVEAHVIEKCAGIIKEKENLEKALGLSGLRELWKDFKGEHTPKDGDGKPINTEELKRIYENIQSFAPLVLSEERLPEETDEYFERRQNLIGRKSGKCLKDDRLSNLTMVIGSRYDLDKFIKGLGSFGNLLYLTLESGLFGRVEAELKKLSSSGASHSGGGNKRKSRKKKTRKKKKKSKKSFKKKRTRKYKKKNNHDMKRIRKRGGGILSWLADLVLSGGWWSRFSKILILTCIILTCILLPHVAAAAAAAKAAASAAAAKAVALKAGTVTYSEIAHPGAIVATAKLTAAASKSAAALVTTVKISIGKVSTIIAGILASRSDRERAPAPPAAAAPAPPELATLVASAPPMSSDQVVLDDDDGYPVLFYCPITSELMTDPVIDPEGNSYERAAIEHWLKRSETSPVTRAPLASHQLSPNRALKDAIVDAVHSKQQAAAAAPAPELEEAAEAAPPPGFAADAAVLAAPAAAVPTAAAVPVAAAVPAAAAAAQQGPEGG
jgi:hypothetical protein